jgi:predicted DNA-binding transcriptional regulator AlpA
MRRAGYFFVLSVRPSQEARRMKTGSNTKSKISAQLAAQSRSSLRSSTRFPQFVPTGEPLPGGEVRLISRAEVLKILGVTNPTLWAWMRSGFFPRSVDIGGKTAFVASEVESWLANLPRSRLKGDDTPVSEQPVTRATAAREG